MKGCVICFDEISAKITKEKKRNKYSVAIMAEISENARNFILIADGVLEAIGRRYFSENARYFMSNAFCPKLPEISPKTDENGRILTSSRSKNFLNFFFQKNFNFFPKIVT